jgi:1-aminocyclopropane-1-carboxylate deaminase/D-cysteine desulfhydrase-like pyridoxal-dependent ACC family enzyme
MPSIFSAWDSRIPRPKRTMNFAKYPHHPLTFGPSPIQPLRRLGDTLVSTGWIQPNQTRQVAAVAAHLGGVPALNAYSLLFRNG